MKTTLNWLKEYVSFDWTPEELAERLTMLGLEVEGVTKQSGEFENVVVAQIVSFVQHPNAERLSVCKVADGKGERQIVCGAKNFVAGDKVPLALPGCTLPTPAGAPPFTIKVSKMRGVESQGMLCSADELGLGKDSDGLLILPPEAKIGQAFAEHLGRSGGDVIYDLEVTPNRPDLNSVIGIAREISALTGNPLRLPEITERSIEQKAETLVRVEIGEAELCPRYVARVVKGVRVGPSPDWLKRRLEQTGIRSINNVVDVTNYVLMEVGQPLHAFDLHLLGAEADGLRTVVIRRAVEGEKFTTLDGQERTLTAEMLLIADRQRGIALAGVMGGLNTEINEQTHDVLIESATFKPQNIRATSKKLDLRTDASYRFERGADVEICDWASRRAAALIQQLAGGEILGGAVDVYPGKQPLKKIPLRTRKTGELLGVDIPAAQQKEYLDRLGLAAQGAGNGDLVAEIPTYRVDLKREVDLIEEIARLYGVDKLPATAPRGIRGANDFDATFDKHAAVRRALVASGLFEAQGQTLISDSAVAGEAIRLENPLSSDMNVLRPSLLPGLLDSLSHNARHQVGDARLFEIGRVFVKEGEKTREEWRVAFALTGLRAVAFWSGAEREAKVDAYDLKGVIEQLFDQLGLRGIQWQKNAGQSGLFVESAALALGKASLGEAGLVNPMLARRLDLRDAVYAAELSLDLLLARSQSARTFKPLAAFPAVRRDVAMLVAEDVGYDRLQTAVRQAKAAHLESFELFDIYRGTGIAPGRKSMACAFTYRGADRTLTEAEVNAAHEKLVAQLRTDLAAEVRA